MEEKYCNALSVSVSFYDVTTSFFKETAGSDINNSTKNTEEIIRIRMSLQLAKAYYNLLGKHLSVYEEQYGRIPELSDADIEPLKSIGVIE